MKIIIAGDFCPSERVITLLEQGNYNAVFGNVSPLIHESSYSIINLECPIVNGNGTPIEKYGPCLKTSDCAINALKFAGFHCVTLANNHFRDFGDEGCLNTIRKLDDSGIDHFGGGANIEDAEKVFYRVIQNKQFAFVNFCEHEFSIASSQRAGSAPVECVENYYRIVEAKHNSDYLIVIVHGGHEGWQYPSPRMRSLYRWYVDLGADVVINHHQHCYSGYELYNEKPIFYGLGNFCFDELGCRNMPWNYGYMVSLEFQEGKVSFDTIPYSQCNYTPEIQLLSGAELSRFEESINEINSIIVEDKLFEENYHSFCACKGGYVASLSPYLNEYVREAAARRWIPLLLPKKKLKIILNFIECESHRDLLVSSIKRTLKMD